MMKPYKQHSIEERRKIETCRATKVSVDVIHTWVDMESLPIFTQMLSVPCSV